MLKRIQIFILSRAIVFSVKLKVRAKISEKVNFEEYFLKENLEKIVSALREKARVNICSFCLKSVSKEPASCFQDCTGVFEALMRESRESESIYTRVRFRDLDTKKYFTLTLIKRDAANEEFTASLARSRGHLHFREVT
jgi:hypothetical protein